MEARAPAVGEEAEEADKTEAALLTDVPKPKQGQDAAVAVAPAGDLVLQIRSCAGGARHRYRVDSARLRRASRFLRILLEPARFGEGVRTAQVLHDALRLHRSVEAVPEAELPCVDVTDPGRISLVNSIGPLMHDFLSILHDIDLRTYPPLANISNLAAVADRFDALPCFEDYARRRKWLHAIDGKYKAKAQPSRTSEDKARQKLMLGVLLGYPSWVGEYSQHLIIGGSLHWSDRGAPSPDGALWWDLPLAIEEEIGYRRKCILSTIDSLQAHFLELYTAHGQQCSLGYDSSPQCDSFQLGEMVRFFGRIKTLEMHGTIAQSRGEGAAAGTAAGFTGDVNQLLDTMRQCPRYRLDEHHQRCAFRTRLLPCIEKIQRHTEPPAGALGVGICGHCWRQDDGGRRRAYSWRRPMPPPLRVSRSTLPDHCDPTGHYPVRDFFTGKDVVWLT